MKIFTIIISVSLASLVSAQTSVTPACLDGSIPADCDGVDDPCQTTVCSSYPEAACRVDPCDQCNPLFYHPETGTKLKCDNEPLICVSCSVTSNNTCGGPGTQTVTTVCEPNEICAVYQADIIFVPGIAPLSVFYRGCVLDSFFEGGDPNCYADDEIQTQVETIFGSGTVQRGYGCVCAEDNCNNFDLGSYPNGEVARCLDNVLGPWFNPGEFTTSSDCAVSFCDNTGEFTCIKDDPCVFNDLSYNNGETFQSGNGDCICNNGDIACTAGNRSRLVCYINDDQSIFDDRDGIEICKEDSECVVGSVQLPQNLIIPNYVRGCVKKDLLEFSGCTNSAQDIVGIYPNFAGANYVQICRCNTSYCNEVDPTFEQPPPGSDACSFRGSMYNHSDVVPLDACNTCICFNGEMLCSDHPCNGLQCFDCVNTPMTECKKVICAEGEICVAQNIFSVFGNNDIVQACIDAKSQSADGDVCITDLDVLIELEIIPEQTAGLFAGTLILCDSNLCNSQAMLQDTCSPKEVTPTTSPPPPVVCHSPDLSDTVPVGETVLYECESCNCVNVQGKGILKCTPTCTAGTSAPVEFLDSCYFDSADGGVIEHGETFSIGCGDCVCNDGDIQCSKGKCPDLICAVGIDFSSFEFCEDDSFCLFLTEVIPEIGITLNTGECILKSDWPHNNETTGPLEGGNARVCSQNFCNLEDIIPGSCEYNGRTYSHLETYNPDECNTCTCVGGTIKCTRLPCNGPICMTFATNTFGLFNQPHANVTCLYDEACLSATGVTTLLGGQGEAVFCGDSSQAPDLDQCTASYSPLEQYLVGAASAQEVCTIAVRTITPPTTTSSTVSPTSTPDSGERTTRSGGTSSSCITEEGNQLKDGETSTVGPCQCTCSRNTAKDLILSCKCEIDVIITFKVDYDLIKDSLKEFEREFIDAMSLLLRVPRDDIVVNEISEGSVIVDATIKSESPETGEELMEKVNDGDLQVEHKGMKLMADSLMISVDQPPSPSSTKPTFFYLIIAICCALSFLILIIGTVCIASTVMRRKSEGRENRLSKRSNHPYDVPPLEEHEPGDKEAGKDNVVSNPYHRSMDLDEAPPSYHRSIGAEVTPQEEVAEAESAKSSSPYLVPMSSDGKVDASSTDLNEDPSDSNALDNPVY